MTSSFSPSRTWSDFTPFNNSTFANFMKYFRAAILLLYGVPALAAPPANFDQRVESLRTSLGVPGVSIAIVENGRTILAKGYGVRKLGHPEPVGPDTIFQTGSTGKAFTVAALAMLVEQGKINWDDKVIDHMPDFRMYDPWVTREMTIRDLLVHRSGLGLGAGDLLFVPRSDLSRKETVRRLRYIKPATSFRSVYAYDNVLYMAAGQLIEEVSGQSWEAFIKENIFKSAGMLHSTDEDAIRLATADRAIPHGRVNGPIVGLGDQEPLDEMAYRSSNSAPAGGLAISANDMSRWLLIQLAHGKLPDSDARLFSEKSSAEMWQPVLLQPIAPRPEQLKPTQPMFYTYALGWDVQDYRGARLIWHGGAVFGSLTAVVLLPEKNVGFSIAINREV
jgi:CubicO group peptidase (beta-lactamase class C family)